MELLKAHQTKNDCYNVAQEMTPCGIVVHSTGANNPNLKRYVDYPDELGTNQYNNHWNKPGYKKMVHAFIGKDKNGKVKVVNTLPYNYCAWGVGKGKKGSYNYDPAYIQFEICEDNLKNEGYYNEAFASAAEFCAMLCKEYNIPVDKIVSHKEASKLGYASAHSDCDHWMKNFGDTMADFREKVNNILNAKTLYRVQTGAFSTEKRAQNHCVKVKNAGFNAFIIYTNGLYKVQVGAFSKIERAEAMVKSLKTKGFDAIIK